MQHVVSGSRSIAAPAGRVYGILADYRDGHPRILPPAFRNVVVEAGGTGAGTILTFDMRVLGATRSFRATVSEPEPGRVLVERNEGAQPSVTTFTVDPAGDSACVVTIRTEMRVRAGPFGWLERVLASAFLQRVYTEELRRLAVRASEPDAQSRA